MREILFRGKRVDNVIMESRLRTNLRTKKLKELRKCNAKKSTV